MKTTKRYTEEELKATEHSNYILITDLARKINDLKGYEAGYGSPKKGKMIINKDGMNYLIDIEPIGEGDIAEKMKRDHYLF